MVQWLNSPQGRYILHWEMQQLDEVVADIFGFNALQLGFAQCDFLRTNRMALRACLGPGEGVDLRCTVSALPIASQSVDLVILPHVLEFADDPHQVLREVERILIPEGQVIILGFNPFSLWGLRRLAGRRNAFPWQGQYLSALRIKDWLKLLAFELEDSRFGCYAPPCSQQKWIDRSHVSETLGQRWWKFSGAVYMLRAIKRVHGMRLITPNWRQQLVRAKALRPIAQKESNGD